MSQKIEQEADGSTLMATISAKNNPEEILEDETCKKTSKRKYKAPSVQESVQLLQATMESLQRQESILTDQQRQDNSMNNSMLENMVVKAARKRLHFNIKDVCAR